MDMTTEILGMKMKNPVMDASGTAGYGEELSCFFSLDLLGAFVTKSCTLEARFGNEQPRVADCRGGLLNCIGLENPGVEIVAKAALPKLFKLTSAPIVCSVAGAREEDYVECVKILNRVEGIRAYEINISCPNVSAGGMSLSSDPKLAKRITAKIKEVSRFPFSMKLTPNVEDIAKIAKACEEGGADALTVANSYQGMRIDLRTGKPILSRGVGGFSGPAILPMALKAVYECAKAVRIPLIGSGGISKAEDVIEYLYAGATAIQVGSMNIKDPCAMKKIVDGLPAVMKRLKINSLRSIIGEALK